MKKCRRVLGCAAVPALLGAVLVWFIYLLISYISMINQVKALTEADPKNGGLLAFPIILIVLLALGVAAVITLGSILMAKAHQKGDDRGCKLRLAAVGMVVFVGVLWLVDLLTLIALLEIRKANGAVNPMPAPTLISVLVLLAVALAGYIAGLAVRKEHKLVTLGSAAAVLAFVELIMLIFDRVNNSADATVVDFILLLAVVVQAVYFFLPKEECCCCCEKEQPAKEEKPRPASRVADIPVEEVQPEPKEEEVLPEAEEVVEEEHEIEVEVPPMPEEEADMEVGPVEPGSPEANEEAKHKLDMLKQAGLISEEEYNKKLAKL